MSTEHEKIQPGRQNVTYENTGTRKKTSYTLYILSEISYRQYFLYFQQYVHFQHGKIETDVKNYFCISNLC